MTNPYYNYFSGVPVAVTRGTSVSLRTEFGLVSAGFDSVNGALNMLAPVASPMFTGTPSGPTAAPGTNTPQLATTAFVASSYAPIANPTFTGIVTIPSGANIAGYALLASPALSGTPSAPTATPGTSTTQLATTAFVMTQAFASVLPAQAGNAGKFVTTDGAAASWAAAASLGANSFSAAQSAPSFIPTGSTVPTIGMYTAGANTLNWSTGGVLRLTLSSSGDLTATGNVGQTSDARLKTNWRSLGENFVYRLAGVQAGTFDRKDYAIRQVGVSAQSLRELMPEAVIEDGEGMLSVVYGPAALAACVILAREVETLKSRIARLECKT